MNNFFCTICGKHKFKNPKHSTFKKALVLCSKCDKKDEQIFK